MHFNSNVPGAVVLKTIASGNAFAKAVSSIKPIGKFTQELPCKVNPNLI